MFQTITFNLGTDSVREETLDGREYFVVPGVLMTEGVHVGSDGPGYYPADELKDACPAWNHKPIVVYHPEKDGKPVSAADYAVLNEKIGMVLNVGWDQKQKFEAWFDKDKTKQKDQRVYDAIVNKEKMEVSTGLFLTQDTSSGVWNTESYDWVARRHKPDHLAILPDRVGACSIADGAGLFANESGISEEYTTWVENRAFSAQRRKELTRSGMAMIDGSFPIVTVQDLRNAVKEVGRAPNKEAAKRHLIKRARALGKVDLLPEDWKVTANGVPFTRNEVSFDDIEGQIRTLLAAKYGKPGQYWDGYLCDVFPAYAIFRESYDGGGTLYMVNYTVKDGTVALTGDAVEVERVTQYQTKDGKLVGNVDSLFLTSEEHRMAGKKELVDGLISNSGGDWTDKDREYLMAKDEKWLEKMGQKPTPPPTGNQTPVQTPVPVLNNGNPPTPPVPQPTGVTVVAQPTTLNEWLKQQPPEIAAVVSQGIDSMNQERTTLIGQITANANNPYSKEELEAITSMPTLRKIAALAGPAPSQNGAFPALPSFFGASGPTPVGNAKEEETPLVMPTINYSELAATTKKR